ncbi:outer membrane beta-barrel protein [Tardiphaga sp.]|uniref:outer membrane protein n=1 Tax=Tardiphaga sp. TaxID=1926292 RepID=UPI0025E81622|nr:outer membrane beta-barrel protein [Tardiphaga sp.]
MKVHLIVPAVLVGLGIGSAAAADLAARSYTKAPAMAVVYDWTGFYIGGNAGYSWGRAKSDGTLTGTQNVSVFRTAGPTLVSSVNSVLAAAPLIGRANVNGFVGGGQAGYNWQSGRFVYGLEADIQGSDEHGSGDICTAAGCPAGTALVTANHKLEWFGTVRGRVGILPMDRLLLYVTGGLAYGEVSSNIAVPAVAWSATKAGWTVGAGGEYAIDNHWSVKLEYLYMDLGNVGSSSGAGTTVTNVLNTPQIAFNTVTTTALSGSGGTSFTDHILRVGVNYKFGGPVVARY